MIHTITCVVTALFAFSLPFLIYTARPVPSGAATQLSATEARSPKPRGFFVSAIVRHVDRQKGLVNLESAVGTFYAAVSPQDVEKLHQGDVIAVYVVDDAAPTIRI
jgi:hypothetical protein